MITVGISTIDAVTLENGRRYMERNGKKYAISDSLHATIQYNRAAKVVIKHLREQVANLELKSSSYR